MTLEQINKLISQVLSSDIVVGHITIMGEEPTIHPHFEEITLLLNESLVQTQKFDP
jgi:organic radical activating enzyme